MYSQLGSDGGSNRLFTLVTVVLVVSASSVVLAGTIAVAPASSATATDLSLSPADETVTAGDAVTYDVVVGTVDGGVSSYDLDVSVSNASVGEITGVSSTIGGQTETTVDGGTASISVFGGDSVDSGTNVTVAQVTVEGENAGDATLSVNPSSVSDEGGVQYTITGTNGAALTVEPISVGEGTNLSLAPSSREIAANESTTYNVTVAAVSGGVGSYDLNVSVSDTSVARITGISDATGGQAGTAVGNASASITVSGGDTVDSGTDVTIARVTVAGDGAGSADLSIQPRSLANETGAAYTIDGTSDATLTVQSTDDGGGEDGTTLALDPTARDATVGESVTYDVTISEVSGGVSSYNLNVSISNASVARITDASSAIGGSERIGGGGDEIQVAVFAGDSVDSGTDVPIAQVTVTGENAGNASLSIDPSSVSDENGVQYNITGTSGAGIAVESASVGEGTNLSLAPSSREIAANESTTYNVTVAAVSGGVGSYDLNVSVSDTSVARIVGVADTTGGQAGTAVGNASASITVSGGDTVDSGTDVTIARVTVAGDGAGSADLSIQPRSLANETGAAYTIDGTSDATLTVQSTGGGDGKLTDLALDPVERRIAPNQSVVYNVTVGTVSDGVGSYDLNVSVDNTSVARITDASSAIGGSTRKAVGPGEVKIGAFAGDTVDSGTNVTIARVTITGENAGNATLSIDPSSLSDENGGDQYTIDGLSGATVTVREVGPDVVGDGDRATDPDGDGLYEDVNGDGDATPGDATVLFNAVFESRPAVLDNPDLFDFNDDGDLRAGDATVLFNEFFS